MSALCNRSFQNPTKVLGSCRYTTEYGLPNLRMFLLLIRSCSQPAIRIREIRVSQSATHKPMLKHPPNGERTNNPVWHWWRAFQFDCNELNNVHKSLAGRPPFSILPSSLRDSLHYRTGWAVRLYKKWHNDTMVCSIREGPNSHETLS